MGGYAFERAKLPPHIAPYCYISRSGNYAGGDGFQSSRGWSERRPRSAAQGLIMEKEALLEVRGLQTYFFGAGRVVKAVDGVNISIRKGETVGIVGESGCGKSVTALSILRLIPWPPSKIVGGSVVFEGEDLLQKSERQMRDIRGGKISMIFQEPRTSMNPVFRIGQQMAEVIRLHQKLSRRASVSRAIEMLEKVRIADGERVINFYPHELSGGMLQRVMIAMELSCNPALLLADEPTTALDVTIQAQILMLLKELQKQLHTAILFITHDLGVVAQVCDRVMVMYRGNIVESATTEELFERPLHPYTRGLLGAVPRMDETQTELTIIPGDVDDLNAEPESCSFLPRCSHATVCCGAERPKQVEVGHEHFVACFLYRA
jgi:oligopeptide/dipeptide ABC transporter ATP-binding protein